MVRLLVSVISAFAIAGCGGGGGSGSDDGDVSTSNPRTDSQIAGEFMRADLTGNWYPGDMMANGSFGMACVDEVHYFETDTGRVRVYGSRSFSETDFRVAADFVDSRIDTAVSKFGLDWSAFAQERPDLSAGTYVDLFGAMVWDHTIDPPIQTVEEAALVWQLATEEEKAYYLGVFERQRAEFFGGVDPGANPGENPFFIEKGTVYVCLSPDMGGNMFGEGSQVGILMPPHHEQWPGSAGKITVHELVHFIQDNLSRAGGPGYILPRWFSEGQAIVYAGQSTAKASEHYNYEPLKVVGFSDEYGDTGDAYEHYGLAYNYLEKANGRDKMRELLRLMKTNTDNPFDAERVVTQTDEWGLPMEYGETISFQRAFDATMVDHNGSPLTLERYKAEYHDLMNQMY